MEGICLNLLEATVALYPANADGTPQLANVIWCGAAAENLRGTERWLKRETQPTGAKYPRRHLLVAQYEIAIGRLWVLPETTPLDWQAGHQQYVLDIVWVEEESQAWHRKTFYGVTISEHGWDARDVETGLVENQLFEAQYMVAAAGTAFDNPPIIPATLPYRVVYTDAVGSVLLYTYNPDTGEFTAQASTTGRATIGNNPFTVAFNGVTAVAIGAAALAYRSARLYRNSGAYIQTSGGVVLQAAGLFEGAPVGALPRLDFYYGDLRTATITPDGIFEVAFIEDAPTAGTGSYSARAGDGTLVAVLAPSGLTASDIQVTG